MLTIFNHKIGGYYHSIVAGRNRAFYIVTRVKIAEKVECVAVVFDRYVRDNSLLKYTLLVQGEHYKLERLLKLPFNNPGAVDYPTWLDLRYKDKSTRVLGRFELKRKIKRKYDGDIALPVLFIKIHRYSFMNYEYKNIRSDCHYTKFITEQNKELINRLKEYWKKQEIQDES